MNRTLKTLCALLLCICLIVSLGATAFAAVGDELRAPKKVISVVYDDSGSMEGERWVFANYAMQALAALLNTGDELYITYMSNPYYAVPQDLNDIKGTVTGIRDWDIYGDTPAGSMDTAFDALKSVNESDESTQFWLVVMTDGGFQDLNSPLQSKLERFAGSKMSNGSGLNVVYMGMGAGAEIVTAKTGDGLYVFQADDASEITGDMEEIAKLVSGRIDADGITQPDEYTVQFSSALPLYSISILSQGSSASVTEARTDEDTLSIQRSIELYAYEPWYTTSDTISGNATVLVMEDAAGAGQIIPAGTYTITFSEPVQLKDLTIQYEPAIGLKAVASRNGTELHDLSGLMSRETVDFEIIPVVPGTDEEIPLQDLPNGITWAVEYEVDGSITARDESRQLKNVTLHSGDGILRGVMQIPGYAPVTYELYLDIEDILVTLGLTVDQPEPLIYYRNTINDGSADGSEVRFHVTSSGAPLAAEEIEALDIKLRVDSVSCDNSVVEGFAGRFGKMAVGCSVRKNDDGSFSLVPHSKLPFTAFLLMAGDYSAQVSIVQVSTATAVGTFTVEPTEDDWISLVISLIVLLILIHLIYVLFFKYKFTGQTVYYEVFKLTSDGEGIELPGESSSITLSPLRGRLLQPFSRACHLKWHGIELIAGPEGTIFLKGKTIAAAAEAFGSSGSNPKTRLGSIARSLTRTVKSDGHREASDYPLGTTPVYFRSSMTDNHLWRLKIE